ncbi:MAG: metallophosphoesterase [Gemmatimonadaceae bacterium]|nr:metallophosphoesterase [Gemmatimonadaceae bacterium]
MRSLPLSVAIAAILLPCSATAQGVAPRDSVIAIAKPTRPLPPEAQSAGVTRFSFIAYGDTRGRRDGQAEQYEHSLVVDEMLRAITRLEKGPDLVRFVLQSGDAVVNGRDPKQWNVSFVSLINRITTAGGVPYYLAPGNHDVTAAGDLENPGRKEGLANYLRAVGGLIPADGNVRRLRGYPTYAFGYGNTFVIAFDSNIAEDTVQFGWVQQQLEGLDRKRYTNVVVFSHHPAFSSGPHGGSIVERPTAAVRARYMPLFRKHKVRLLLTGHEHLFEHWVERYRDASGAPQRMDHIVSGGGGAPLYTYQGEPDTRQYIRDAGADSVRLTHLVKPGMQAGDNPYHFLIVHVDGTRLSFDVVGVDWGRDWQPYRSARVVLSDTTTR